MERATGIEPVLPTWESELPLLYFHHLQNRSGKINVHALHTVHAVPDLRIAAGRLRDGFYHALLFATTDLRLTFWIGEECFLSRRIWTSNYEALSCETVQQDRELKFPRHFLLHKVECLCSLSTG